MEFCSYRLKVQDNPVRSTTWQPVRTATLLTTIYPLFRPEAWLPPKVNLRIIPNVQALTLPTDTGVVADDRVPQDNVADGRKFTDNGI